MRNFVIALLAILGAGALQAQENITLTEIWKEYKFAPEYVSGIRSMQDGKHYTILTKDGIEKYSYKTQSKVSDLVKGSFSDYQFNADEQYLLLEQNPKSIYRYSKLATYNLLHLPTKKQFSLNNGKPIQEPHLSPDGEKIAFVAQNNLFVQNIRTQEIWQLTTDGNKNEIINGITDWVYEEEFGFVRAFEWNKSSDKIAFIKFDEKKVPEISMDIFGNELYPTDLTFKYPKAGETNSKVSVWVYDLKKQSEKQVNLSQYNDFYVPKIKFETGSTSTTDDLFVFVSNRHQNKLDAWKLDANTLDGEILFTEKDNAWIETDNLLFEYMYKQKRSKKEVEAILWASERDGNRHLYKIDYKTGKVKKQLTKGDWEITKFYGFSPEKNTAYFQSNRMGSKYKSVHKFDLKNGKIFDLSTDKGTNNAQFSSDYSYFINTFSASNQPPVYTLNEGDTGKQLKTLKDNKRVKDLMATKGVSTVEHSTLSVNGNELNMWTIKPLNYDPNKAYPLFMFQYSGPGSQKANDAWDAYNYWWFQMLAQNGYMVACVDGRGTGGKGAKFKKSTYMQLGKYEIEDQIAAAKKLGERKDIDADRIGIFGWSFGGYMSSLAMTKGANVFKMGIAVAPVTNWRFYDTVYTERFMRTPQENASGYDDNSPINHVSKMKGPFLLVHGSADDNVHPQNTYRMSEALVQADKQFELFIYTDKNHGIYGGNTRKHLYQKMTTFIQQNL